MWRSLISECPIAVAMPRAAAAAAKAMVMEVSPVSQPPLRGVREGEAGHPSSRRSGRRGLGRGRAVAPLVHELIEFGAVLGGAQPVKEVAELALLFVELAQRLLT